jgi:hypothetical protein
LELPPLDSRWQPPSAKSEQEKASPEARASADPTSFAILFIAANNQLQSPSAEDDVPSSAGRDQIAADEDEREEHQDEIERVPR